MCARKAVNGPGDLAINGAQPMFSEPLHVGRPNIGSAAELKAHLDTILANKWLTNDGPYVQRLEEAIARQSGVRHCVAINNGTIALEIAIRALELKGEVIIPSWTFIATAHALSWQGITPIFADIHPATHNLDVDSVRSKITPRTSGIIGVHLWGRPAPVRELQTLADSSGVALMYDSAHAFGCTLGGRSLAQFGRCSVLSFHATKVFNTFEGGAVLTDDEELADRVRLMRNFGFRGYDNVIYPGTNGKMPEINAAMGIVNLNSVTDFVESNRANYLEYRHQLQSIPGVRLIDYDEQNTPNYQYVVLEIDESVGRASRDDVLAALRAENVLARRYFWPGCHGMLPYRLTQPDAAKDLPHTEGAASRVLVLPTGNSIGQGEIADICAVIRMVLQGK